MIQFTLNRKRCKRASTARLTALAERIIMEANLDGLGPTASMYLTEDNFAQRVGGVVRRIKRAVGWKARDNHSEDSDGPLLEIHK